MQTNSHDMLLEKLNSIDLSRITTLQNELNSINKSIEIEFQKTILPLLTNPTLDSISIIRGHLESQIGDLPSILSEHFMQAACIVMYNETYENND